MGSKPISIPSSINIFQWMLALTTYNRGAISVQALHFPFVAALAALHHEPISCVIVGGRAGRRDMERRIGLALRTGGALAQVLGQRQEPGVASQAEDDQDDAER